MKKFTLIYLFLYFCATTSAEKTEVRFISQTPKEASEVPLLFERHQIEYHTLSHTNWKKKFPYTPLAQFAIAYTPDALLIAYKATEKGFIVQYTKDQDPVFLDACMEFFVQPENDSIYYNFECNCLGYLLMQAGTTLRPRHQAPEHILNSIKRWTSIEKKQPAYAEEATSWEVALIIPYTCFYKHSINSLGGKTVRANVYKCGGKGQYEHYVSWSPIHTPRPNVHTPVFFGSMTFIVP